MFKKLYRKLWNIKERIRLIAFPREQFLFLKCLHCGCLGKEHCEEAGEFYNRDLNPCMTCDCKDFEEA